MNQTKSPRSQVRVIWILISLLLLAWGGCYIKYAEGKMVAELASISDRDFKYRVREFRPSRNLALLFPGINSTYYYSCELMWRHIPIASQLYFVDPSYRAKQITIKSENPGVVVFHFDNGAKLVAKGGGIGQIVSWENP